MSAEWFYHQDGQRRGPVSSADLHMLASTGRLLPTDHVWCVGMADWVPAHTLSTLSALMPPVEPPPFHGSPAAPPRASASGSIEKRCCICHSDVSHLQRTKDDRGHYYCKPCWVAKAQAQREFPIHASAPPSAPAAAFPSLQLQQAMAVPVDDPLADLAVASHRPADGPPQRKLRRRRANSMLPFLFIGVSIFFVLAVGGLAYYLHLYKYNDNSAPAIGSAIVPPKPEKPFAELIRGVWISQDGKSTVTFQKEFVTVTREGGIPIKVPYRIAFSGKSASFEPNDKTSLVVRLGKDNQLILQETGSQFGVLFARQADQPPVSTGKSSDTADK